MPTQNPTEVICITTDVYDSEVARQHYKEEVRAAKCIPLVWARQVLLKGRWRIAYCVCRLPLNAVDQAFVDDMKEAVKQQSRDVTYPFIGRAMPSDLFYLDEKNEFHAIGATVQ